MKRTVLAVAAVLAVLVLAGCGGGSTRAPSAASTSVPPALSRAAADACAAHCNRLQQQTRACPGIGQTPPDLFTGSGLEAPKYPTMCSFDMAGGFEAVDAVQKSLEDASPAGASHLPDLFAALDQAKTAHNLYADRCSMVGLTPQYDRPQDVRDCSEAVRESIRWLPIVARELKSAAAGA